MPIDLNDVQEQALKSISITRDEIQKQFSKYTNDDTVQDYTLKRLFSYMSSRSQTVSYLVSSGYPWDAEIILRSFYEAAVKIWLISCTPEIEREDLVAEFWGDYASMHNFKRAHKAKFGAEFFNEVGKSHDSDVYAALTDSSIFDFGNTNKAQRKALAQKWSFSDIVTFLEQHSPDSFPMIGAQALKHIYGMQSHLLHSDDVALDLMLDRSLRNDEERELLAAAHICRIFSDQVSFWALSAKALCNKFENQSPLDTAVWTNCMAVISMTQPFQDRHDEFQKKTYQK